MRVATKTLESHLPTALIIYQKHALQTTMVEMGDYAAAVNWVPEIRALEAHLNAGNVTMG